MLPLVLKNESDHLLPQKQFAEFETKGAAGFFDHHLGLELPEERMEDDDKILLTRYTPLGVVGAVGTVTSIIVGRDFR